MEMGGETFENLQTGLPTISFHRVYIKCVAYITWCTNFHSL